MKPLIWWRISSRPMRCEPQAETPGLWPHRQIFGFFLGQRALNRIVVQNQGPTAGVEEFEGDRLIELSRHRHREPEPQVVQCGTFLLTVPVGTTSRSTMSSTSTKRWSTPSTLDTYPVEEAPGATSRSSSGTRTVQAVDRTTRAVRCSRSVSAKVHPVGVCASARIRSVCRQPHAKQRRVTWVCSPKYGMSSMWVRSRSPHHRRMWGMVHRRLAPFTTASRRPQGGRSRPHLRRLGRPRCRGAEPECACP